MISITTNTADTMLPLIINESPKSSLYDKEARVSRAKTLDGGAYIQNNGFSHGDRTLSVVAVLDESQKTILDHLMSNFSKICVAFSDGFYSGAISRIKTRGKDHTIEIMIEREART